VCFSKEVDSRGNASDFFFFGKCHVKKSADTLTVMSFPWISPGGKKYGAAKTFHVPNEIPYTSDCP
jgi:hypothetical protein